MKRRSISLLLAMVMILALIPTAFAVYSYHMDVTVEEPVVGAKPAATAVSRNNKDTDNPKAIPVSETPQVKWSGELDANGCFKAGVAYTVTVTERMGDARWSKGTYNFKTAGAVINLHKVTDAVLSEDGRTVTGSYTFPALKTSEQIAAEEAQKEAEKQAAQDAKNEKDHAADLARRWSLAEASKVENYPLGSPITLVVNEETLRESGYFEMDFDAHPYLSTGAYYNFALSKTVVGKGNGYDTYAISNSSYIAAKQHAWATGEVLAASEAGLIDKAVMGSDYTRSINRLQFSSIAVRLAEKMAGKTIAPAPSGTFTDTDNEYVRKAAAAGITSGVGGGRFDPNGTLTRQQMAAFLHRALQWVKNNSDTEYTVYESKLGDYTDAGQLASWAKEPMAFMNALGLISGTSGTTLSPNGTCTIEQAIVVADRSLYADRTGWYQKNSSGEDWLVYGTRVWVYYKNGQACYRNPYGFELTGVTFSKGLRPIKDR